jgi:hypothetical protein
MNQEILSNCFDVHWLKNNHQMIHYFGLGFIQLKIDDSHRMHFYTPELPPITSEEDVHNHRYDFESLILKGEFEQDIFEVTWPQFGEFGTTHLLEQESCKEGCSADENDAFPVKVKLLATNHYMAGSRYLINHETFHRVRATNCITLIERSEYKKELAEVVRPINAGKICPFSKKIEVEKLWDIVGKMVIEDVN